MDARSNEVDVTGEIIREWETMERSGKRWHAAAWSLTRVDTKAVGQNSLRLLISRNRKCLNKHTPILCQTVCVWQADVQSAS